MNDSFRVYMQHAIDRIAHTMAFVNRVVVHRLEQEMDPL